MRKSEKRNFYVQSAFKVVLDCIGDGVFTVDRNFRITSFNAAAEEITGVPAEEALGKPCYDVFKADICEADCALKNSIENNQSLMKYPVSIIRADGTKISIAITASALKDHEGALIGGVETFRDPLLIEEPNREIPEIQSLENILSRNRRMRQILSMIPRIARSDGTVLIQGESGTGKEMIAHALHNLSKHKDGPLVIVNCGALPDSLLESELFGYVAGAFTDAKKDKPGRFAQADGGTIFLDEIGDVSPALQTRLLRILQEKSFEPLGSTRTIRTNVRVLAATNKDLCEEVEAGRFRRDLYYRVNVVQIALPPLRERREDIPLIVESIIQKQNLITGKSIKRLSPRVAQAFQEYDWPGNVRELENAIEHAFILCEDDMILCEHLPPSLPFQKESGEEKDTGVLKTLRQIEMDALVGALERSNWNKSAAARELGLDNSTVWRKCRRLGIRPPSGKG